MNSFQDILPEDSVLCCSDHTEDDLQGCSYSKYNLGIPQDTK